MSFAKVLDHPATAPDPRALRLRFAALFAEFLRANYRNPEEVAVAFGVRFQTALNWWNGANRPSGDTVALAELRHPGHLARVIGAGR